MREKKMKVFLSSPGGFKGGDVKARPAMILREFCVRESYSSPQGGHIVRTKYFPPQEGGGKYYFFKVGRYGGQPSSLMAFPQKGGPIGEFALSYWEEDILVPPPRPEDTGWRLVETVCLF